VGAISIFEVQKLALKRIECGGSDKETEVPGSNRRRPLTCSVPRAENTINIYDRALFRHVWSFLFIIHKNSGIHKPCGTHKRRKTKETNNLVRTNPRRVLSSHIGIHDLNKIPASQYERIGCPVRKGISKLHFSQSKCYGPGWSADFYRLPDSPVPIVLNTYFVRGDIKRSAHWNTAV
jgi:hypothetical protein